jgi:hypothetical protein
LAIYHDAIVFEGVQLGQQDAELGAFPDLVAGQINITTSSELHSAAVSLRKRWREGCRGRIDLIGGYRYFRFRENLLIQENLVSTNPGGLIQQGTTLDVFDRFATENDFHGGELGLAAQFHRGCWSLDLLAKVALGNMRQAAMIDGAATVTTPGDPPETSPGGLLALPTNMGRHRRDAFAVLPEIGLGLRYQASDCLALTAGYTLIYLNHILRTGDQIDPAVNPTQLTNFDQTGGPLLGEPRPAVLMNDTDFWAQGINLGIEWRR